MPGTDPADPGIGRVPSCVLRHKPETAGPTRDAGGRALNEAVFAGIPMPLTCAQFKQVVATGNKHRLSIDTDGGRIGAHRGCCLPVDPGLAPATPPASLPRGIATRNRDGIRAEGLMRQSRQRVPLSPQADTARKVGRNRRKPLILRAAANQTRTHGFPFHRAENGVWLTDHAPPYDLSEATE